MPPAHLPRLFNASQNIGRICLITGAASQKGIGRATAKLFGAHGGRVVCTDLAKMEGEGLKLVEEIKKDGGEASWC
jgi:NAD(P)-dependent dehydrogenase (short-subunit alcohol dehydrogenase family)